MIGRIPILDVEPVLDCGRRPAKAVTGETFPVSATVIREGHEMLAAAVVLRGPDGQRSPLAYLRELTPGTDRYGTDVTVTAEGLWFFQVEAWGDPIAHWRHDAAIKVPLGLEAELMLTEGALLFERAARGVRGDGSSWRVRAAQASLASRASTVLDPGPAGVTQAGTATATGLASATAASATAPAPRRRPHGRERRAALGQRRAGGAGRPGGPGHAAPGRGPTP